MKFVRFAFLTILLMAIGLLAAACGSDPTPTAAPVKPSASPAAAAAPTATPKPAPAPAPAPKPTATPAPPFYKDKTITIMVGFSPGGGFDTFARTIARHMPKHIPGEPNIIVQNRPGAGSLVAANVGYSKQPGDGLTIVEFIYSIVMQPLLGDAAAKFDPSKFTYLGDPSGGGVSVVWVRNDHPIKSMEDWKNSSEPLIFGGSGPGTSLNTLPRTIEKMGFPTKVVLGYGGTAPITLAMQQGEVDAMVLTLSTMQASYGHLIDNKIIRPLAKLNKGTGTDDVDVPLLDKYVTANDQKELIDLHKALGSNVFTFALPPGVPADRVKILRKAFDDTVNDSDYKAEIARQGRVWNYVKGETMQASVKTLAGTSDSVMKLYKAFLTSK